MRIQGVIGTNKLLLLLLKVRGRRLTKEAFVNKNDARIFAFPRYGLANRETSDEQSFPVNGQTSHTIAKMIIYIKIKDQTKFTEKTNWKDCDSDANYVFRQFEYRSFTRKGFLNNIDRI